MNIEFDSEELEKSHFNFLWASLRLNAIETLHGLLD